MKIMKCQLTNYNDRPDKGAQNCTVVHHHHGGVFQTIKWKKLNNSKLGEDWRVWLFI